MSPVYVGICHKNDLMVTQLVNIKLVTDAAAESRERKTKLVILDDIGRRHVAFNGVLHFAEDRQDRLCFRVACFTSTTGRGIRSVLSVRYTVSPHIEVPVLLQVPDYIFALNSVLPISSSLELYVFRLVVEPSPVWELGC